MIFRAKLRALERDRVRLPRGGRLLAIQVRYRGEDRERFANELGWALQAPTKPSSACSRSTASTWP